MITTLRSRNFSLLWFGGLISMAGNWMLYIALPIYVYQLTQSTLATSLMFITSALPNIVLGSVAGVFVDRWERKRTMVIANVLMAITILPLLLVQSADWLPLVYLVGFVESCIGQFFSPAENALLPQLVAEDRLVSANALNSLNNSLARLVGPALGGLLVGLWGLGGVIVGDALSYAIAAILIALITVVSQPARTTDAAEASGALTAVWREWIDGMRLIRRNRAVTLLILITSITAIGEGLFSTLLVVWVNKILNGGALELGWLMSAQAIGGLLGGAVIGWIGNRIAPALLLGFCSLVFGFIDIVIVNAPLFFPSIAIVIALFIVVGVPGTGFGAGLTTLFQKLVSDEYRGRIFGAYGTTYALLSLVGMWIAGLLGDVVGPVPLLNIQGGGYMLAGLLVLFLLRPVVRSLHPEKAPVPTLDPATS